MDNQKTTKNNQENPQEVRLSQKHFFDILNEKPIAFNPAFAKATNSITAGLLLSQLLYWNRKGNNPEWFYKTIEEIKQETALSREEQDTAIKKLKKLNLIEVKVMGIPAKRYFKINLNELQKLVCGVYANQFAGFTQTSLRDSHKQVCGVHTNKFVGFTQTITDNTTENTTEITPPYNPPPPSRGGDCLSSSPSAEEKTGEEEEENEERENQEVRRETTTDVQPQSSLPSTPPGASEPSSELSEFFMKKKALREKKGLSSRFKTLEKKPSRRARLLSLSNSLVSQAPRPDQDSPASPLEDAFAPLSYEEIWKIAWELNVDTEDVKRKQQEILDRVADGSWNPAWGNTLVFAIKTFLRSDIKKGYIPTLNELERMALADDHPKKIEQRKRLMKILVEKGVL